MPTSCKKSVFCLVFQSKFVHTLIFNRHISCPVQFSFLDMSILICLMKSTSYNASSYAIFFKFLPLPLPYITRCYYKRELNCFQKQLIWCNFTLHCYLVNYITMMKCHFNEVSTPIVIICGTWWGRTGCFSVRWVVKWGTVPSCKCPSGKWLLSLLWSNIWCSVPWCIWGTSSRFETGPQHSVWCLPSAKAVIKETVIFTQQVNAEIMRK